MRESLFQLTDFLSDLIKCYASVFSQENEGEKSYAKAKKALLDRMNALRDRQAQQISYYTLVCKAAAIRRREGHLKKYCMYVDNFICFEIITLNTKCTFLQLAHAQHTSSDVYCKLNEGSLKEKLMRIMRQQVTLSHNR